VGLKTNTFEPTKNKFRYRKRSMYSEAQQEYLNRFGKHLEMLRKRNKLSFRKLAQRCNIDYSNLKKYEKGEINPSMLSLIDLAGALGVTTKELMDF